MMFTLMANKFASVVQACRIEPAFVGDDPFRKAIGADSRFEKCGFSYLMTLLRERKMKCFSGDVTLTG